MAQPIQFSVVIIKLKARVAAEDQRSASSGGQAWAQLSEASQGTQEWEQRLGQWLELLQRLYRRAKRLVFRVRPCLNFVCSSQRPCRLVHESSVEPTAPSLEAHISGAGTAEEAAPRSARLQRSRSSVGAG